MKKIYTIAIVSFLVIASLGISIYQYIDTTKAELANAANTKQANGHSWSEMESDSDSIQVTGQTITNLALPTNAGDAASKAYVDAAGGGGTWDTCYVLYSTASGTACGSGYTTIAHHYGNSTSWIIDTADGATNALAFLLTVGGYSYPVTFGYCYTSHSITDCATTWHGTNSGTLTFGAWGAAGTRPAVSLGGNLIMAAPINTTTSSAMTVSLCCK